MEHIPPAQCFAASAVALHSPIIVYYSIRGMRQMQWLLSPGVDVFAYIPKQVVKETGTAKRIRGYEDVIRVLLQRA